MSSVIQACVVAFPSIDLIDFFSPVETLLHAVDNGEKCFAVTIAGETDEIKTIQGPVVKTNISLEAAAADLSRFDVLIIPGSDYKDTKDICDTENHPIKNLIQQFRLLPSEDTRRHPRLLVSVCSGAFMLASVGVLAGRRATTHYGLLSQLQELCDKHGQTEISRKRYVDGGFLETGTRVITSGGITSGFDVSLYVIELLCGYACAERAADVLDYQWRRSEALV